MGNVLQFPFMKRATERAKLIVERDELLRELDQDIDEMVRHEIYRRLSAVTRMISRIEMYDALEGFQKPKSLYSSNGRFTVCAKLSNWKYSPPSPKEPEDG